MARSDPKAGGGTGSEVRQRTIDVRIRLTPVEAEVLDRAVAEQGFGGPSARGDWIRWRLGLLQPRAISFKKATGARYPFSGGQRMVAALADVGKQLRHIDALLSEGPAANDASLRVQVEAVLSITEAAISAVVDAAAKDGE